MGTSVSHPSAARSAVASLRQYGQSVWLDFIRRSLMAGGELQRMVEEDGLGGMTSNPAIFEKAIDGSNDYAAAIEEISKNPRLEPKAIYEILAVKDIQDAADILRPVYERTGTGDGYVSLEVSPELANDTAATIEEARHLWKAVARPNLMIKVPATPAGLPAIRTLIGEGINVNVTLLFARDAYESVALAYVEGSGSAGRSRGAPRPRRQRGQLLREPHRHAVDALLAEKLKTAAGAEKARLEGLLGKVAIANAKLAYQSYKKIFAGPRWEALEGEGRPGAARALGQHGYEEPPLQRRALRRGADRPRHRQHGAAGDALRLPRPWTPPRQPRGGRAEAMETLDALESVRDLPPQGHRRSSRRRPQEVRRALHEAAQGGGAPMPGGQQGADQRSEPRAAPGPRRGSRREARGLGRPGRHPSALGGRRHAVDGQRRGHWLGWLGIVESQLDDPTPSSGSGRRRGKEGFTHALLLGMGGSSLCPEVWKETFGKIAGSPELFVLDSTDPAQVKAFEAKIDLAKTLFIVSSKSGSTLEPNIFKAYFFDRVKQALGADKAGEPLRGGDRPRLEPGEGGPGRGLPPRLSRRQDHRRALLRPVELRHGAGGGDGPGRGAAPRRGGAHAPAPAPRACPPRRTPVSCWARSSASPPARASTS